MRKHGLRTVSAMVLAAFWLTACGGGDDAAAATTALAISSPLEQAGAQVPAPGQTQSPAPAASAAQAAAPAPPAQAATPVQGPVQGPAQGPVTAPGSAEFRVNTTTAGSQENSSITRLKNGSHVIAWISETSASGTTPPPGGQGVCTQRYGADGTALGQETCMAPDVVVLSKPALASLDDGGYVLVWPVRQSGQGFHHNLLAQRFDANGAPVRAVQQINSTTLSSYLFNTIAVAGLADGGYVVSWAAASPIATSVDIYARRIGADGVPCPCGPEKRVNTLGDSPNQIIRSDQAVAALADGGYVVIWVGTGQSGFGGAAVYAQRYGANNAPIGRETTLTPDTAGNLLGAVFPAISGLPGGGYVVTYILHRRELDSVIAVQSFRADGTALSAQSAVNPLLAPLPTCTRQGTVGPCAHPLESPAVATLGDGGYVVVWNEGIGPAATEVHARRYSADGVPARAARQIASGFKPAVSGASLGGFLLSLQRSDDSSEGIFARYFDARAISGSAAP